MRSRRCRINHSAHNRFTLFAFAAVSALGLLLSGCRQDMHNQPKFIPLRSSEFFPDRRSARPPVPGTVAQLEDKDVDREQLDPTSYLLTGRHGSALGNDLPFPADTPEQRRDILRRGQNRYNIYCTPCHSWTGDGYGMIVQRGYKQPPTFHSDRLRNAPLGHFYDVISNGFGAMPDYAAQIKPEDRWMIAAYIRALQRSQNAIEADVEDRSKLNTSTDQVVVPPTSKRDEIAPRPQPGGERP